MPIYTYRCPNAHDHDRIRRWLHADDASPCPVCAQSTQRILTAHHALPDGLYSHAPNLGDEAKFQRNLEGIQRLKERIARRKDGEREIRRT